MQPNRQAGMLFQYSRYRTEVVEMRVRQPDCAKVRPAAGYAPQNFGRIPGRVNYHAIITTLIGHDEAIGADRPEGQFFNLQHDLYWSPARILQWSSSMDYTSTAVQPL